MSHRTTQQLSARIEANQQPWLSEDSTSCCLMSVVYTQSLLKIPGVDGGKHLAQLNYPQQHSPTTLRLKLRKSKKFSTSTLLRSSVAIWLLVWLRTLTSLYTTPSGIYVQRQNTYLLRALLSVQLWLSQFSMKENFLYTDSWKTYNPNQTIFLLGPS